MTMCTQQQFGVIALKKNQQLVVAGSEVRRLNAFSLSGRNFLFILKKVTRLYRTVQTVRAVVIQATSHHIGGIDC